MTEARPDRFADRAALQDALWSALAHQDYMQISLSALADAAGISHRQAVLVAGSVERVLLGALQEMDDAILAQCAEDFADDMQANVHEKLLEGLTQRFEAYADKRTGLHSISKACPRQPALAMQLSSNLYSFVDRLLILCGDDEGGLWKMARIHGICGVVLKASTAWQRDDSPDLSKTIKVLDQDLKKAAEWAVSLRVLAADEGMEENND
ncbi:MAG: hypothetical protein ACPIDR_00805 [Candidatus Puniceispirillaceae bacterium]